MQDELDKKPDERDIPDSNSHEPVIKEQIDVNEEQDLDDLVHRVIKDKVEPAEESDIDDIVHNLPFASSEDSTSHQDPDDLVHGH